MTSHSKESKGDLSFFDVLRFAASYWRRQPGKLAVIISLVAAASVVEAYLPTALSSLLAAAREHKNDRDVVLHLGIFLGAYLTHAILFSVSYIIYNGFETKVFKMLVDDAFAHIYRLPESFFATTFTGAIISKINRARTKIETFEDHVLLVIFPTFIVLTGTLALMAVRFPALAALMAAYLCLLTVLSAFLVIRVSGPAQGAYAEEQDSYGAHLADAVVGISTTKSFAQEHQELESFFEITHELRIKNARAYILANVAGFAQRLFLWGMLALMLGGGVWYLLHGRATVENIAYLAFAYTILQSYIRELGRNIKDLLTASYDLHAIIWILREEPEAPHERELPFLDIRKGAIEFDKVGFTYPGRADATFCGFSLSIPAGESVAVVGHSGSGKTSFVRLLQLLYPLQEGRILIDGQNTAKGSRRSLRSAISLVPQDPILFHRTLRENIAYARTGTTMDEIREAARLAHIDAFIENLPEGYETLVGERGIKLSGGERQRIAIARAILADRPILILDEATSSLDSSSEKAIQDALQTLTHGRTSIMIAHRLSTILDADRILVFDKGRIVEEGTHHQLVHRPDGIYAEFFRLQSGGFIADGNR